MHSRSIQLNWIRHQYSKKLAKVTNISDYKAKIGNIMINIAVTHLI
jgi:hypothetical protein